MREIRTSGSVRDGGGDVPIYSALGVPNRREVAPECRGFMEVAVRGEEMQRTSGECLRQVMQEQTSKHRRQHRDRQKEPRPAGDPTGAVRRDPTTRNQEVDVRVVLEGLPLGVQHAQETDLRAQVLWISRDRAQRLRCCPKQDIVDDGLVLVGDVADRGRQREDHVVVGHGQQFGLPLGEPFLGGNGLALRTVAVAAGIVGDVHVRTVFATLDMAAECRGTAALDGRHDLQLREADMSGVGVAVLPR